MKATLLQLLLLTPVLLTKISAAEEDPGGIRFTNFASLSTMEFGKAVDFNGDGRYEILATGNMRPHWNSGTNFVPGTALNYSRDDLPLPIILGDFDNDADADIFFVRRTEFTTIRRSTICWNTGKESFTNLPPVSFSPVQYGAGAAADFDNDGDLDIVINGSTNLNGAFGRSTTRYFENLGRGEFYERHIGLPGFEDGAVSCADYDNDGDMDLLLSGYTTNNTTARTILYRNEPEGFVESGIAFPSLIQDAPLPVSVDWGDYDQDGDLDLLLGGAELQAGGPRKPYVQIFRNEGTTFTPVDWPGTNFTIWARGYWADFDADGDLDVIAQGRLYLNEGSSDFVASETLASTRGKVTAGFFDGDTNPDMLSVEMDGAIRALRNITVATNSAPSVPTELAAMQTNNSVSFSWSAALDAQQTHGLTYNLRIGTSPGGSEVMSAMANPTNGMLHIAQLGNAGLRTNWTIHRLVAGNYYWSVQAIDHGFLGSSFAPEQTLVVTSSVPVVENWFITNVSATAAVLAAKIHPNGADTEYYLEITSGSSTRVTTTRQTADGVTEEITLQNFSGLSPSTTYSARLVASNSFGISYGPTVVFTTAPFASFTEIGLALPQFTAEVDALVVDIDQDSDLDVIAAPAIPRMLRKYLNAAGTFTDGGSLNIPLPTAARMPAAADFNNDGWGDFKTFGTSVFYRRENGNYRQVTTITTLDTPPALADFNNDGNVDIFTPATSVAESIIHLNQGRERFVSSDILTGVGQFADAGDYDNDGDADILLWGLTNSAEGSLRSVMVLLNSDFRSFSNATQTFPGTAFSAEWADLDNDRDLDLIIVTSTNNAEGTRQLEIHLNSTVESDPIILLTNDSMISTRTVDFDRDGDVDIFLRDDTQLGERLRLFENLGDATFEERNPGLPSFPKNGVRFADLDGDLMPDLLLNAPTQNVVRPRFFRNNHVTASPPPPVPTNLTAQVGLMSATLAWELPEESISSNRSAGSFNLRIGTTPGGSELMSAMSHPITGARYVAARGNAGQGGSWTIRELPPGTYHWSVQSVDHAFNGSRFAPESTFTISPYERVPKLLSVSQSTNTWVYLMMDGPTRSRVQLEGTSDFADWMPVGDTTYIGGEPIEMGLGPYYNHEHRFYRLRLAD